jgi:hypothetical protein
MARTAALEAARAEAPATPVRESAAVGAAGAEIALRAWRVLDQFPDVHVIERLELAAQTPRLPLAESVFPTDHKETTVTKVKVLFTMVVPAVSEVALAETA